MRQMNGVQLEVQYMAPHRSSRTRSSRRSAAASVLHPKPDGRALAAASPHGPTSLEVARVEDGRNVQLLEVNLKVHGPEPLSLVRKRRPGVETLAPVLLVHGFGQNRQAWHLPQRSFENHLAASGFDVFSLDLRGHGASGAEHGARRARGVDDYILGDMPAVVDAVLAHSGHPRLFALGHSLGGIVCAAAAALQPERFAGVVTLGPPHALGRGHLVLGSALKVASVFARTGVLRGSRVRLPVDLIGKAVHMTRAAWDSPRAPIPVRAWKPGAFSKDELRSYISGSFDSDSLGVVHDLCGLASTGQLHSRARALSYTALIESSTLPLLVLAGSEDLLANPGSVKPIFERSGARDRSYVKLDAGHGDLLVGAQAPASTWPVVTRWLQARLGAVVAPGSLPPGCHDGGQARSA